MQNKLFSRILHYIFEHLVWYKDDFDSNAFILVSPMVEYYRHAQDLFHRTIAIPRLSDKYLSNQKR